MASFFDYENMAKELLDNYDDEELKNEFFSIFDLTNKRKITNDDVIKKRLKEFKQHNVMVLVGNGFDISVIHKLNKSHNTAYKGFVEYVEYEKDFEGKKNQIYERVKKEKVLSDIYNDIKEAIEKYEGDDRSVVETNGKEKDLSDVLKEMDANIENIVSTLKDKESNKDICLDWADFERVIGDVIEDKYKTVVKNVVEELKDTDNDKKVEEEAREYARKEFDFIKDDIREISNEFSKFLNDIVTSDHLYNINNLVREEGEKEGEKEGKKRLAYQSMACFLDDIGSKYDYWVLAEHLGDDDSGVLESVTYIEDKTTNFYVHNFDLLYYMFVNFNYTQLLEDYLCLDEDQFDPNGFYKTVDRNIEFYNYETGTPKYYNEEEINDPYSNAYLMCETIHPNGVQSVTRSLLFGSDEYYDNSKKPIQIEDIINEEKMKLSKSYRGQYNRYYKNLFRDVEMFIIYGMSLSHTDGWWLDGIVNKLVKMGKRKWKEEERKWKPELIIYYFLNEHRDKEIDSIEKYKINDFESEDINDMFMYVKELFRKACVKYNPNNEDLNWEEVFNQIHVVLYTKNVTSFLGFEKAVPGFEKAVPSKDTERKNQKTDERNPEPANERKKYIAHEDRVFHWEENVKMTH